MSALYFFKCGPRKEKQQQKKNCLQICNVCVRISKTLTCLNIKMESKLKGF